MRRLGAHSPLLAAVAALGLACAAETADASVLRRCGARTPVLCGRVSVPLDRTGAVPGAISLAVRVVPAATGRAPTVLLLSGGPGQPAIPVLGALADPRSSPLGAVRRIRNLLAFDPRGTGDSGLLRCPLLEISETFDVGPEAADCANRLGPRRDYYQTRDAADDVEAVRAALGVPRLQIVAVSYGTKVAMSYARRYPQRVDRMVLDSTVPLGGDPLGQLTLNASARVLRDLCRGPCTAFAPDPVGDLQAVVASMASGPILGYTVGGDGLHHGARLDRLRLLNLIGAGDLGPPSLDAELPAALRSARQNDPAPLLRLSRIAVAASEIIDPRQLSAGLNFATVCTEGPLPWSTSTPVESRLAEAQARVTALGDAAFAPFDVQTVLETLPGGCLTWPPPARPAEDDSGPLPDVPTLLVTGVDDRRTPLEGAQGVAAALPRSQLVSIPATGHSPITTDLTGCADGVIQRFLVGRAPGRCPRGRRLVAATPVAPLSASALPAAPGVPGRAGRTLCAVASTIADARVHALDPVYSERFIRVGHGRVGALRGGTMALRLTPTRIFATLDRYSYVPGVAVSGQRVVSGGEVRVSGPAASPGTLRITSRGSVSGRLAGRAVRSQLRPCLQPQLATILFGSRPARRVKALAVQARLGR